MRRTDQAFMYGFLFLGVILVAIPVGALLYGALQTTSPGAPGQSWTVGNFKMAFFSAEYLRAVRNTVVLSTLVAALSTAFGTVLAWVTARTDTPGRSVLENLFLIPTFLSPLVGATGWLVLGAKNSGLINVYARKWLGVQGHLVDISTFAGMVWVMVLFFTPVAYLYLVAALRSVDATLEEAARMAGARNWRVMWGITVPSVTPALITAAIMVWVLSAEMFSVPGLFIGPGEHEPLAYRIFLSGRSYPPNHPMAAAAGTVLVVITLLLLMAYRYITRIEGRYVTLGGKGARPRISSLGHWRWVTSAMAWIYVVASVILPYVGLIIGSIQKFLGSPLNANSVTLKNWRQLMSPAMATALRNSLILGVVVASVVVVMGAVTGYAITRKKVKQTSLWDYVISSTLGIPGIAFGIGMVWAYVRTPIYGTVLVLVLAYVTRYTANGLRAASTGLMQISKDLEEAASLAGASSRRVLWDITAPLLKPTLFSAWALTLITVLRELSMASVLYTPHSRVLAVLAWDLLESGEYGQACVVGLFQTALVVAILVAVRLIFNIRLTGATAFDELVEDLP